MSMFDVDTETTLELKEPSMYSVILLNDNYTPMDFVIQLLVQVFGHTAESAMEVTMMVHTNGKGSAGTYSFEIAQQKQLDARTAAEQFGHPLRLVLEEN